MSIFNLFRRKRQPQFERIQPHNLMLQRWLQRLELHYAVGRAGRGDWCWVVYDGTIRLALYIDVMADGAGYVALVTPYSFDVQYVSVPQYHIAPTGYSAQTGVQPRYNRDAQQWEFWRNQNAEDDEDTREMETM